MAHRTAKDAYDELHFGDPKVAKRLQDELIAELNKGASTLRREIRKLRDLRYLNQLHRLLGFWREMNEKPRPTPAPRTPRATKSQRRKGSRR